MWMCRRSKSQENGRQGRRPGSCNKIALSQGLAGQFPVPYFKIFVSLGRKEAGINGLPIWHVFCACISPVIYRRDAQRGNSARTIHPMMTGRARFVLRRRAKCPDATSDFSKPCAKLESITLASARRAGDHARRRRTLWGARFDEG